VRAVPVPRSIFRMTFRVPRGLDPRREKAAAALDILNIVAARDADYARKRNGVGFSRADSSRGHLLSKLSIDAALRDRTLLSDRLKMPAKYQRQASRIGISIRCEQPLHSPIDVYAQVGGTASYTLGSPMFA
jgi:hypothetical protein